MTEETPRCEDADKEGHILCQEEKHLWRPILFRKCQCCGIVRGFPKGSQPEEAPATEASPGQGRE